jgi:hypothetical protein
VLAFVDGEGLKPVMPNGYWVAVVKRLLSRIPGKVLLPGDGAFAAVVLPEIVAHIVWLNAGSAELPLPMSIGGVPAPPLATSLFVTFTFAVPFELPARTRMPMPVVLRTVLLLMMVFRIGVASVVPPTWRAPRWRRSGM